MLSKFPVTTDRGEYRVDIYEDDVLGLITIDIFVPTTVFKWFSRKETKVFRKVDSRCGFKREYRADLIGFATEKVRAYEHRVYDLANIPSATPEAIEAFRNWDGNITKEESE